MKLILVCLFLAIVHAKYVHNTIKTKEQFIFLGKFCFDTKGEGTLNFTARTDEATDLSVVTYDDVSGSWNAVYKSSLSCEEKVKKAKSNTSFVSGELLQFGFDDVIRPHFWYLALANCKGEQIEVEYEMKFLQFDNNWNKQFSFDEQGLPLMYILFFITFILGFGVHLFGDFQFIRARSFHPILRLLTLSLLCIVLSLMFYLIHYANYSENGVGIKFMQVMGQIFDYVAGLIFMFLLILIAKGWGITHPTISHFQEQKLVLLGIIAVFFVMYVVLLFWELFGIDPASTLYLYQSAPGIVFLVVRILTLLYFIWSLQKTIREENDATKRRFYVIFGVGYTLWFLSLPMIVLISLSLAGWVRMKIVTAIYLCTITLGYGVISFLLWPSRASKYFQVAVPDMLSSTYERL